MAGVPSIMQAMLDAVAHAQDRATMNLSRSSRGLPGALCHAARRRAEGAPRRRDRFLPILRRGFTNQFVVRARDEEQLAAAGAAEEGSRKNSWPSASRCRTNRKVKPPLELARDPMSQPQPKGFPVSWDQFHRDARALAWRLAGAGPFKAIVCITRGGLVPAAIVSRELGIRVIETVCVASYHDYTSQGELARS